MLKWRLMLTTLPYVCAVVALTVAREHLLGWHGALELGDVAALLTAGAFLIGFMLSGTMADYKESEKLPGEIATTLETLDDHLALAAVKKPELDARALRGRVDELAAAVERWLHGHGAVDAVLDRIGATTELAQEIERLGHWTSGRVLAELSGLRRTVTRIHVIQSTTFLQPGYALLDTLVTAIVAMLLLARWRSPVVEYTLTTAITLVYVYMVRLIRDVDAPFDHGGAGQRGAAEVDLAPIGAFRTRLRSRVAPVTPLVGVEDRVA
jgi:hypothetical protein